MVPKWWTPKIILFLYFRFTYPFYHLSTIFLSYFHQVLSTFNEAFMLWLFHKLHHSYEASADSQGPPWLFGWKWIGAGVWPPWLWTPPCYYHNFLGVSRIGWSHTFLVITMVIVSDHTLLLFLRDQGWHVLWNWWSVTHDFPRHVMIPSHWAANHWTSCGGFCPVAQVQSLGIGGATCNHCLV